MALECKIVLATRKCPLVCLHRCVTLFVRPTPLVVLVWPLLQMFNSAIMTSDKATAKTRRPPFNRLCRYLSQITRTGEHTKLDLLLANLEQFAAGSHGSDRFLSSILRGRPRLRITGYKKFHELSRICSLSLLVLFFFFVFSQSMRPMPVSRRQL